MRQDSYRSIKWMRDVAERGDLKAQMALGRLYLTGLGEMGSDPGEAEKWLSITASRGDKEASTLLKEATAARQSVQAEYRWYNRWRPVSTTGIPDIPIAGIGEPADGITIRFCRSGT